MKWLHERLATTRRQRGFTLLELLLSMTLTALLLGMLSAGIYAVVNDWQDESVGLEDELDHALMLLQVERALLGAFPHSYVDNERLARLIYFLGEDDSLSFVSTVSPQRRSGLTAWQLYNDPDEGIMLRLAAAYGDNPDARLEEATPVVLLRGYRLQARYLLDRDNDSDKEWLDSWQADELQSLPQAVWLQWIPDDPDLDTLELLAPIRANRHVEIEPNLPAS